MLFSWEYKLIYVCRASYHVVFVGVFLYLLSSSNSDKSWFLVVPKIPPSIYINLSISPALDNHVSAAVRIPKAQLERSLQKVHLSRSLPINFWMMSFFYWNKWYKWSSPRYWHHECRILLLYYPSKELSQYTLPAVRRPLERVDDFPNFPS